MEAETHPDPFHEATTHGLQRAMQVASFAGTAAQVFVYHQKAQARAAAEQDERDRRVLLAQTRAKRDSGRAGWTPALDPQWLRSASLRDTARAWGAAAPYADPNVPWYEPTAATALRKTEERLRDLHPFAMARYDRLRADGVGPAEAMEETAPLFSLSPHARYWPFAPSPLLSAGTGADWKGADLTAAGTEPDGTPSAEALEQRGRSIVVALQKRARAERREPLGPDELRTVLATVTNLPDDVIRYITRPATADGRAISEQDRAATAERVRAADLDAATNREATPRLDERTDNLAQAEDAAGDASAASARRTAPWKQDFPVPIQEVVAGAANPASTAAPQTAPARPATGRAARPDGPGHA